MNISLGVWPPRLNCIKSGPFHPPETMALVSSLHLKMEPTRIELSECVIDLMEPARWRGHTVVKAGSNFAQQENIRKIAA